MNLIIGTNGNLLCIKILLNIIFIFSLLGNKSLISSETPKIGTSSKTAAALRLATDPENSFVDELKGYVIVFTVLYINATMNISMNMVIASILYLGAVGPVLQGILWNSAFLNQAFVLKILDFRNVGLKNQTFQN